MTTGDIKLYITKYLYNLPDWTYVSGIEDTAIATDLLNVNNWKREKKFKFASFDEFNEKYHNCEMKDLLEYCDCEFGTKPVDNKKYTFRMFTCYDNNDCGDWTLIFFTDETDSNFVYASTTRD